MRVIIKESQLESFILKYLNNQDLITLDSPDKIYFVNSINDEFSQICIDKEDGFCEVNYMLVNEICGFFSIKKTYCLDLITKWLLDSKEILVSDIWSAPDYLRSNIRVKNVYQ